MNISAVNLLKNDNCAKTSFGAIENAAIRFPGSSSRKSAENYKEQGNACAQSGDKDRAISYYQKSIEQDSSYLPPYYNLAKIYYEKGDNKNAINYYMQILQQDSSDTEAMIDLGVIFKEEGNYKDAKTLLYQAFIIDPMNDLAKRNLLEVQNLELVQTNPSLAVYQKSNQEQTNLQTAFAMACRHLPPEIVNNVQDVKLKFGKTALMGGDANIAQYSNSTKDITVTDKYTWAAPQLIAAYLTHEMIHAYDKDSYTSVQEEQDAYREAAKFWTANSGGIKDPEMDFVKQLYLENPKSLDKKVEEVYRTKDPSIPNTSPNHGMLVAAVNLQYKMCQATRIFNSILKGESEMKSMGVLHEFKLLSNVYK